MANLILIVEDAPTQLAIFKKTIEDAGYKVQTAVTGEEAMDMVLRDGYDLVVLDLLLPRVDGFEICRRIRQNEKSKKVKILAVTSFDVPGIKEKTKAAGVDDTLLKPFEPEELVSRIKKLLA